MSQIARQHPYISDPEQLAQLGRVKAAVAMGKLWCRECGARFKVAPKEGHQLNDTMVRELQCGPCPTCHNIGGLVPDSRTRQA